MSTEVAPSGGVGTTPVNLKQRLNLMNGITMIVGQIIGSGIFISPRGIQQDSGSPGLSLLIWALSGIISMIGAVCYIELGTTIPKSGGSYAYIKEAFGEKFGFILIWIHVIIVHPTAQAVIAVTFADYVLKPVFPNCEVPFMASRVLAACCILFLIALQCRSVTACARIQDWFSYAKVIALLMIVGLGAKSLFEHGTNVGALGDLWGGTTVTADGLVKSFYSGLYAYAGWDTLNFMTEELKDPYRNLPLSIYISLPLITLVYVFANVGYYCVLTSEELMNSGAVAITFAQKTLGSGAWVMSILVAMSTFGALNSSLFASSRMFYAAAREHQLPGYFAMISPEYLTPVPSLILTGFFSLAYLFSDVGSLIDYYSFMYWLAVGVSIAAQLYLRFKRPEMPRPIVFSLFFPITFCAISGLLVVVPYVTDTTNSLIGTALLLTGVPLYALFIHKSGKFAPECFGKISKCLTIFLQKVFPVIYAELGPEMM